MGDMIPLFESSFNNTLAALDAHKIEFIARLPRNQALERHVEPHRYRFGRPSRCGWRVASLHLPEQGDRTTGVGPQPGASRA
ncbi:hypothetical protein LRD18_02275 [Halorhodospira halochloris]|uniref:hypothetical protein n=1 Tax=Halorhodospira halochloris TaxID=1052 RepID=UPI001EE7AC19|nr:hypothetical protein [Halorhodospira halochloris]MCG5529701.1 hypothetical protein [Halorhodospira halochloris]